MIRGAADIYGPIPGEGYVSLARFQQWQQQTTAASLKSQRDGMANAIMTYNQSRPAGAAALPVPATLAPAGHQLSPTARAVARAHRIGVVTQGQGGSAASYTFVDGLSQDPSLAYYLQDLTPAQLQTALDGRSPTGDIITLLQQEQTATGAGYLPCGTPENPNCGPVSGGFSFSSLPTWAWLAGGAFAVLLLRR